jgi:pilus assembly protein Flp/PilA
MLHRIKKSAVGLWRDESGASLLEYSLLIGLILAVSATAVITVGGWASNQWTNLKGVLNAG